MLLHHCFTLNPFQENTYLVWDKDSKELAIIDPGNNNTQENNSLIAFIEKEDLKVKYILNTHGHLDHIYGNRFLKEKYGVSLLGSEKELINMRSSDLAAERYGLQSPNSPMLDGYLVEGDEVKLGQNILEVMFTPGHAEGHITFINNESNLCFSGDVLFYDSIGRWDFPGGDFEVLKESILKKLYTLPDDTIVFPGHGPTTTISREKMFNNYVKIGG